MVREDTDEASPSALPCHGCPPCGVLPPPHPPASHHSPAWISLPQIGCVIPKLARKAGKPSSYSPPAAAGQVTPSTTQNPTASLWDAGNPLKRGGNPTALHRVFIPPMGIWKKMRMGFPGCSRAFLGGGQVRGSSMRQRLVGWLLVLKPLGDGIWTPSTDLGAQVIGVCAHQPGKSRRDW